MNFKERFKALIIDEQGAELAEYAVGVALLVAIGVVVYKVLGNAINDSNSGTAARVEARFRQWILGYLGCQVRPECYAANRDPFCDRRCVRWTT